VQGGDPPRVATWLLETLRLPRSAWRWRRRPRAAGRTRRSDEARGEEGGQTFVAAAALVWRADLRTAQGPDALLLQNAFKRLRTLRHPHVLKCIEGAETEEGTVLTLVTERATLLASWLAAHMEDDDFEAAYVGGLDSLSSALAFLHGDCRLLHGCLTTDTMWVTRSGDWKLAGFELLGDAGTDGSGPDRHLTSNDGAGLYPDLHTPSERASRDWELGAGPSAARFGLNTFALGLQLAEMFSRGPLVHSSSDHKAIASGSWPGSSGVPPSLRPLVVKLRCLVLRSRASAADVLGYAYFKVPLLGARLLPGRAGAEGGDG
jgi:hypothetical protein